MGQLPNFVKSGEPARLFPILADTSKEGRTLSIFLACLESVGGFGRALLSGLGQKIGMRGRIDTFTEVVLATSAGDTKHRPDGLIVVNTDKSTWTALVEAKVGAAELTNAQIEGYLNLAKLNGIDAVITLSNQFTPLPTHHPLTVSSLLTRKVSPVLSRQVSDHVQLAMGRAEATDPTLRLKKAITALTANASLVADIVIPNAAAPMQVTADFRKRVLSVSMWLRAPGDRKSTKARLSWLLKQLSGTEPKDLHIRLFWPGRAKATQYPLATLVESPQIATEERPGMVVASFEVLLVRELGAKFVQRKVIVSELVKSASQFHAGVGGRLTAWQAKPAKIAEGKLEPASVGTEALRDEVEREALERAG